MQRTLSLRFAGATAGSILVLGGFEATHAQTVYVQPAGYENVEGNSSSGIPWSYVSARVQQSDSNRIGQPMPTITSLSWRRDRSASTTAVARTIDVTILMGKNDINSFSNTFASNWLAQPATVYATRPTNLPDLTQAPPAPPAPFAVTIPLDFAFVYDGVDSLMWEVQVDNGVTSTYSLDWVSAATTTNGATTTALGTGCTTANGTMGLTTAFSANTTNLNLSFSTAQGPSASGLVVLFGLVDPNLNVPGLCAVLHSDGLVSLPLGVTSATGALSSALVSVPWSPSFGGLTLFSQTAAPDASQPGIGVALSNGRQSPLPLTAGGPAPAGIKRTYSLTSSSAVTGSAPSVSAVVTQIVY